MKWLRFQMLRPKESFGSLLARFYTFRMEPEQALPAQLRALGRSPGEVGTVYMRMGTGQDFEYKDDPEKTAENRKKGFFTVGDIGVMDEDGFLFLRDRKSHMIISGGVNIYPAEIENVLLGHPKVADAAVFGIPHPDWGEEVKAVVELVDGVEPSDEVASEILTYCGEKLAKFKLPRSVDFTDEMPRDPNGKLYKRKLRDPYWEGHEAKI